MPPTTGKAPPPDGHDRSVPAEKQKSAPDWDQPTILPSSASAADTDPDVTMYGDGDATSLPHVSGPVPRSDKARDDETKLDRAEWTPRPPSTERRVPPTLGGKSSAGQGSGAEAGGQE